MTWKELPPGPYACLTTLKRANWTAYPVGGCVRDFLLGRTPGDIDICTAAPPEVVLSLFERTIPTGLQHGTVTVLTPDGPVEITTFRRDGTYSDGRHPDAVDFHAGFLEDLSRRDFTINAMALAEDGTILDPFQGQKDLQRKKIRCVGCPTQRFSEDALRMFRAGRFAAQLGFSLDADTETAIFSCADLAVHVAAERVQVELEKTLCSPQPEQTTLFFGQGLMKRYGDPPKASLLPLRNLPCTPLARWSGLCAALGRDPASFLRALKLPRKIYHPCSLGWNIWQRGLPEGENETGWRRLLTQHPVEAIRAAAWMGDWNGQHASGPFEKVLSKRECWSVQDLALTGGDLLSLGLKGPEIGAAQRFLLDHVVECPHDNTAEKLKQQLQRWHTEY